MFLKKPRAGFTLIEVLAALAVITGMMVIGVRLGTRWVAEKREQTFLQRVDSEWNYATARSERTKEALAFYFEPSTDEAPARLVLNTDVQPRYQLDFPATLSIGSPSTLSTKPDWQYAQPKTVTIKSSLGNVYTLSIEMGCARLFIHKNGVQVE